MSPPSSASCQIFALLSISVTSGRQGVHVLLSPIAIAILGRGRGRTLLTLAGQSFGQLELLARNTKYNRARTGTCQLECL
jgi:hypothetical protein